MTKISKKILISGMVAVDRFEFVSETQYSTNFQPVLDFKIEPKKQVSFNKLAQLSSGPPKKHEDHGLEKLKKRAKAKYFTTAYLRHLIDLESPLKKSYLNTVFCCQIIHQVEDKFTSRYCNNRWCTVCNRIRIAKAINGYLPQMKAFKEPFFVTLTIPNVRAGELRCTITGMTKTWRIIYKALKWHSIALVGLRKTECTYNSDQDSYHPHFHLIVDGKELAGRIIYEWLHRYPAASIKAQDKREADELSMLELFKYFTKIISKEKLYIPALDTIFQAMAGLRVFQPFGIKKVSEEVEELQAEVIEDLVKREALWEWINCDWIDKSTNQCLTGYQPSEEIKLLLANIVY